MLLRIRLVAIPSCASGASPERHPTLGRLSWRDLFLVRSRVEEAVTFVERNRSTIFRHDAEPNLCWPNRPRPSENGIDKRIPDALPAGERCDPHGEELHVVAAAEAAEHSSRCAVNFGDDVALRRIQAIAPTLLPVPLVRPLGERRAECIRRLLERGQTEFAPSPPLLSGDSANRDNRTRLSPLKHDRCMGPSRAGARPRTGLKAWGSRGRDRNRRRSRRTPGWVGAAVGDNRVGRDVS